MAVDREEAVRALIDIASDDSDVTLQRLAFEALGAAGGPISREFLLSVATNPRDPYGYDMRKLAVTALGHACAVE